MRDPRSHRRYVTAARAYIAQHPPGTPCAICGRGIDTTLSGMSTWGPTIEHRVPIRTLKRHAMDDAELLTLACDQTMWGIAHLHCQRKQGGASSHETRQGPTPSRW